MIVDKKIVGLNLSLEQLKGLFFAFLKSMTAMGRFEEKYPDRKFGGSFDHFKETKHAANDNSSLLMVRGSSNTQGV